VSTASLYRGPCVNRRACDPSGRYAT
jgi:hypothetical protein